MKKLMITTASILTLTLAMPAFASSDMECGNADPATWMTEDAAKAKGAELGYDVANIKVEDGCYELYARKDGKKFEVFLNPVSGDVVRVKSDD